MMNREFSDWNQVLGKLQPSIDVRVLRSANRFSVEPACSNSDQNSAAPRKSTPITYSCLRSAGVHPELRYSHPKNATVRPSRK